ncbi:hypothetical protein DYD21_06340 [Rhodohalobacter sp. SW132]|uniref:hypothetical protein n=1 Tax=Rhodohalobacter sp. SW132 TaxID=2293433 RepID=UPI000E24BEB2|nr:hypothetical protein [Rhodohalobacter sp. SW132]REL38223.1 hypothetical protein DYD21_06340 [Rhodohalobacter sp. SW132]
MKKVMTTTISTLAALLLFASASVMAQQSDYQVQQDFRADYNEITDRINSAASSDDVSDINDQIDQLEADYSGYEELLNAALYPDTFEDRVAILRTSLGGAESNIEVVNELNERIEGLQAEIDEFRTQIAQMDEDSEAVRQRLERASANERRLSGLVTQYRQNLESRDEFVSDFLENLLNRYQAMDSQTQSEIAEASESLEDDPLSLLRTILSEYINQADRETGLEAQDYLRMRAQHAYFETVWDRVGSRMANAYASDSPVQAEQEITDLLAAWQASVDNKLWNALSTAFNQNGIELPAFTSENAFNNALNSFVDNASATAREQNEEADVQLYESFSNYWNNTVKSDWGEYLTTGNVLSQGQIASIDVKLGDWARSAEPVSNLMFILFLISLAVIIGLIVLLVTKKS